MPIIPAQVLYFIIQGVFKNLPFCELHSDDFILLVILFCNDPIPTRVVARAVL